MFPTLTRRAPRALALVCGLLVLAGCKIQLYVPPGGHVETLSGAYECPTGELCYYDVVDRFFHHSFAAIPAPGYRFAGWKVLPRGLCGGSTEPCLVSTRGLDDVPELDAFLESDQEFFFLEPEFETVREGPAYLQRYCEVLIANLEETAVRAQIYTTQGINSCPQEEWDALDADQIAVEFNATRAILNGPRYWVLDDISVGGQLLTGSLDPYPGNRISFVDLTMREVTTAVLPLDAATAEGGIYQEITVYRDTIWHYLPGRRVFQLKSPDGQRYFMQSFSQAVDPELQLADLTTLGERLQHLPEGWTYSSYILEGSLDLPSVAERAQVITDEFANTYQKLP